MKGRRAAKNDVFLYQIPLIRAADRVSPRPRVGGTRGRFSTENKLKWHPKGSVGRFSGPMARPVAAADQHLTDADDSVPISTPSWFPISHSPLFEWAHADIDHIDIQIWWFHVA